MEVRQYSLQIYIKVCLYTLLSTVASPKCILDDLHKLFSKFFWSNKEDGRRKHWSSWLNLCLPKDEGELGFRSMYDVSKALFAKLW